MKPILLQWNDFILYSYPLFIGLAWGLAFRLSEYLLYWKKKTQNSLRFLYLGIFLSSWIGAKLIFLLSSVKENHLEYTLSSNFWLGGGFVFYGGFLGGAFFVLIYSKLLKKFPLSDIYLLLPSLCFAHAIGRVGCFLAGCCYGSSCDLPFAVEMKSALRHPVQLYETFGLLILGVFLIQILKRGSRSFLVFQSYIIGYSSLRFVIEFFRGDKLRGIYFLGLSTSQIISLILVILLSSYLIYEKVTQRSLEKSFLL